MDGLPEICETFQINSYVKEHFRTATFEIIWESSPFLNNVLGCSSNTLTGRDSVNQVFHKMLQNFLEHLIHLSTEASLERISLVSWCITIFRFVTTLTEKNLFQIHPKSKYLELQSYVPII